MKELLFLICILILYFYPILYPPIACFTSIFFAKDNNRNYISVALVFSSAIVSSFIAATVSPKGDTEQQLVSFLNKSYVHILDEASRFEPLYQVYEYFLHLLIGDNEKIFLLITSLVFNIISTIAIFRICFILNQLNITTYIIFCIYYALVSPSMGNHLYLLRSSISCAVLLLGISFYGGKNILFYLLGIASFFIHYGSIILIFPFLIQKYLKEILRSNYFFNATQNYLIIILPLILILVQASKGVVNSVILGFLEISGLQQANYFLGQRDFDSSLNLNNPVFIIQLVFALFCFMELKEDKNVSISSLHNSKPYDVYHYNLLELLRTTVQILIIIVIITLPFSLLPYRLGYFYFSYFPLFLVNLPYVSINFKKYYKHLLFFSLLTVLYFLFYKIPKMHYTDYDYISSSIVVLDSKPLEYNMVKLMEEFF